MTDAARPREEVTRDGVLAVVRDLAKELHPEQRGAPSPRLDSSLDRDLGIDSLGRSELMLRLDQAFRVDLPDELIAEAETPRDLVDAVLQARPPPARPAKRAAAKAAPLPQASEPAEAGTLIEVLAHHASRYGDRPHVFLWKATGEEEVITYTDLQQRARAVAGGLLGRGLRRGDRVAIMLPTEAAFFSAFFGVLFAGGVPVPIYPPFRPSQLEEHLRRQAGILRNAEARFLVTNEEVRRVATLLHGLVDSLADILVASELESARPVTDSLPADPDTVALIQYTSGSTGDPKGVVLTHANLLANIRAMGTALEATSADVFVSWLPLYHDMGLIGAWLGSLYYAAAAVITSPFTFLTDPSRWLRIMHEHRATLSAAPNFAFELCLKRVEDEDIEGLDLSSLRSVVNGAEPVSSATVRRFIERFAPYGFRAEALAPVYGLAECSVGLAFPPPGRAPVVDKIEREALARTGEARPAAQDQPVIELVACGQPLPGHEVRIVDQYGRELPERREGRLQFKGPSTTRGYFKDEEKTRALFDGEWLESGDRAYLAGGDIFITGRSKDIIIRAGRNVYPQELEEVVGAVEGVRKGCVAAFSTRDERFGTDRLVVLAETRLTDDAALDRLRQKVAEASTSVLDLPPDEIALLPPRTVPKTSSGKIRRSQARHLYEAGSLAGAPRSLIWQLLRLWVAGLRHRWQRRTHEAAEFAYAAWWWSLLGVIAVPAWSLVVLLPKRRWRHAAVGGAARLFLRLTGCLLRVEAEARLPEDRVIIAANHASYLDSLVLTAALCGPLSFTAKEDLAGQWVAGPFLRRLGTLFLRRADPRGGVEDTARATAAVRTGQRTVWFPEGTLTRRPGLLGFQLGPFVAAVEAQVPVAPVTITGTRSILRGGQWFPRRGTIRLHIGEPIAPDGDDFDAALRLRNEVRSAILARSGEPDLAREPVSF